jgi:Secretion system C-terminal sorting domain
VLGDIIKCTITVPSGACFIPTTGVSNTINVTGTLIVTPTISIYSITGTDTVCSGPSVIYLSNTNVTGGSYQWQVNGANSGFNSPAFNYTPLNGDQVLCIINAPAASCYNAPNGTSNVRTVTVIPSADPTVTVTGNNPVCQGTTVTYHASTNIIGGSYQWAVNNNPVGTNSANFTYAPVDSDYITCTITEPVYPPTGPCYTQVAATNSPFVAVVQDPTVPFIDIHAPALAPIGSTVTVTGTVTSAVGAYTIQWKNHGTTFATTSVPMVTYTKQVGKDSITAIVTPTAPGCFGSPASNYQIVNVGTATSVGNTPTKGGISVFPNPFNDHLVVSCLNINDRVCVYDLLGRKVTQVWLVETMQAEQTFNISNLPSAGYILQIWNEDGSTRESISLIKK